MSSPITANGPASGAKASVSLEHAIEHFLSDLPDETARRIRLASGIDSSALRAAYRESRQALLLDTRLRFELEQEIQDFIDALDEASPPAAKVTTLSWQLQLLGLDLIWPATSVLQVYDPPEDSAAAEYGPDLSPSLPRVRVKRTLVLEGDLWRSVLQQMSPTAGRRVFDPRSPAVGAQTAGLLAPVRSTASAVRQPLCLPTAVAGSLGEPAAQPDSAAFALCGQ